MTIPLYLHKDPPRLENLTMDDARLRSKAIRQFGKNIIDDFQRSYQLPQRAPETGGGVLVPVHGMGKVGIVGAGVGGLYAAMLLQDLGIPFEILEASGRVGGRLFTYKFSKQEHDYFVSTRPLALPPSWRQKPIDFVHHAGRWRHALPQYAAHGPCLRTL